jgi:hypothetical protein
MLALSLRNLDGQAVLIEATHVDFRAPLTRVAWLVNKREAASCPRRQTTERRPYVVEPGQTTRQETVQLLEVSTVTDEPPLSSEPEPTSTERVACPECGSKEAVVVFTHFAYVACFCPDCDFSWSWSSSSSRFRATERSG